MQTLCKESPFKKDFLQTYARKTAVELTSFLFKSEQRNSSHNRRSSHLFVKIKSRTNNLFKSTIKGCTSFSLANISSQKCCDNRRSVTNNVYLQVYSF